MPADEPPIAKAAYDTMATSYKDITNTPLRDCYEWPTVKALLPVLEEQTILDAACGNGAYTEHFLETGAEVIGIDASPAIISQARDRFDATDNVTLREADLTDGLQFLDDAAVDLVVSQLTLEHIQDWESVFEAFARILKPGGAIVVSTSHPVRDYVDAEFEVRNHILSNTATYPTVERVDRDWGEDELFAVPFYRRPLAKIFGPPTRQGLVVEAVREPSVTPEFEDAAPHYAAQFETNPPLFLCLRFRKPGG